METPKEGGPLFIQSEHPHEVDYMPGNVPQNKTPASNKTPGSEYVTESVVLENKHD